MYWVDTLSIVLSFIVLGAGCLFIWKVYFNPRNTPAIGPVPEILPSPPDDLPVGLVGYLLFINRVGTSIEATIFHLANKGLIRIEQPIANGKPAEDQIIYRLKDSDKYLAEEYILESFSNYSGKELAFVHEDNKDKYRDLLEKDAMDNEFFRVSPTKKAFRLIKFWLPFFIASLIYGFFADRSSGQDTFLAIPFMELIVFGSLIFLLPFVKREWTEKGYREAALWRAYYRHLKNILVSENITDEDIKNWNIHFPYIIDQGGRSKKNVSRWLRKFLSKNVPVPDWYDIVIVPSKPGFVSQPEMPKSKSRYFVDTVKNNYWRFKDINPSSNF